jgi:hypothetical protein
MKHKTDEEEIRKEQVICTEIPSRRFIDWIGRSYQGEERERERYVLGTQIQDEQIIV